VSTLLNDGARVAAKNKYLNTPYDVATAPAVRAVLKAAAKQQASKGAVTAAVAQQAHASNLEKYYLVESTLKTAVDAAGRAQPGNVQSIEKLSSALASAKAMETSAAAVETGEKALERLQCAQGLADAVAATRRGAPIVTQKAYVELVNALSRRLKAAQELDAAPSVQEEAEGLIKRSHAEYWLRAGCTPFDDVECAEEYNVPDMDRLAELIAKATSEEADGALLVTAGKLLARLRSELKVKRSMASVPEVKLPIADAPKDYWEEQDQGAIEDDYEDFPLPPPDTNEYVWKPSKSLGLLRAAMEAIDAAMTEAEECGAFAELVAEGKAVQKATSDKLKQLERKDEEDRELAQAAVLKQAKKLKKGKGKGKKK